MVELTGWHRDHARAALREALGLLKYCTEQKITFTRSQPWELDRTFTNYLLPQQKLIFKQRHGAKVTKRHDRATTPHQRAIIHPAMRKIPIIRTNAAFKQIKPAALSRSILALTGRLETIALAKTPAAIKPAVNQAWNS